MFIFFLNNLSKGFERSLNPFFSIFNHSDRAFLSRCSSVRKYFRIIITILWFLLFVLLIFSVSAKLLTSSYHPKLWPVLRLCLSPAWVAPVLHSYLATCSQQPCFLSLASSCPSIKMAALLVNLNASL